MTIIDLDNGLATHRQQTITWTNDGLIYCQIDASHGHKGLNVSGGYKLVNSLYLLLNIRTIEHATVCKNFKKSNHVHIQF